MRYTPTHYAKTLFNLLKENPENQKEIVASFAKKFVASGAVKDLRAVNEAFKREWYDRENIIPVTVTSAETGLFTREELKGIAGKEVELTENKDPNVVAGARIRIGDRRIDNTLARRLSDLRNALTR